MIVLMSKNSGRYKSPANCCLNIQERSDWKDRIILVKHASRRDNKEVNDYLFYWTL